MISAVPLYILGISAFYHDSAAVLLRDGEIVAAAQEERFTRIKHDASFPASAVRYCLNAADVNLSDVAHIAFYDKPLLKFERLLETYLAFAPKGIRSFTTAMPIWIKEKLFLKKLLRQELAKIGQLSAGDLPPLLFGLHHESHAASAFFPAPFDEAAVLCLDGVGEWATTSVWYGSGNTMEPLWELHFPHSLGLLYSAFTYFAGFKVNSGEYKLMGLAPYGEPRFADQIRTEIIDLKEDGTFRLNMRYFDFAAGLKMTSRVFEELFGRKARQPEAELTQFDMDMARSVQAVIEESVLNIGRAIHSETGAKALCLAGGVALNCVANGHLLRAGPFDDIWIQPASGDAGGALGVALAVWHGYLGKPRVAANGDRMSAALLGPAYHADEIQSCLDILQLPYQQYDDSRLMDDISNRLAKGAVIGWYQGRMEFGPRALGNRSILGDARNPQMQTRINLKIKFRESFRPFAPAVLEESVGDWFDLDHSSPYMLLVAPVHAKQLSAYPDAGQSGSGLAALKVVRSTIPAVTHVDNSARIQTVNRSDNPRFHRLISKFAERTGTPVVVNTSFNIRGEPIVNTPEEAITCFLKTGMDCLVMDNFVLNKADISDPEGVLKQIAQLAAARKPAIDRKAEIAVIRKNGIVLGLFVAAIFGLLVPRFSQTQWGWWPWLAGGGIALLASVAPRLVAPAVRGWIGLARLMGRFNGKLLTGLVYIIFIIPMGIIQRLTGRTGVPKGADESLLTYRIQSEKRTPDHMEKPF